MRRPEVLLEVRTNQAVLIAEHFVHLDIQWILPIPNGALPLAAEVIRHMPNTQIVPTKVLDERKPREAELDQFTRPCTFPVFSHHLQTPRIIAVDLPPQEEPVLIVDDVFQLGLTARDVLSVLKSKLTIRGFAVGREFYQGSMNPIREYYGLAVFATARVKI